VRAQLQDESFEEKGEPAVQASPERRYQANLSVAGLDPWGSAVQAAFMLDLS